MPPYLSGFVCIFHHSAPGLSPKHTIYVLSIYTWIVSCGKDEYKQKEPGIAPISKNRKWCRRCALLWILLMAKIHGYHFDRRNDLRKCAIRSIKKKMFVANNLKNAQLGRIAYNTKKAENTNKGITFFWVNNIASFWASTLLRIVSIPFPMAPVWPEGF